MFQLKHLFWTYEEDWQELVVLFEALRTRMVPGVYDYGFLRR